MPHGDRQADASVQEHHDPQRGRHLLATAGFAAGTRVVIDQAFAATLYDSEISHHCHLTFEACSSPLRCGACKHARYANKENQRKAWSTGHREECAALAKCHPRVPPPTVRLVAKMFWLQLRCEHHLRGGTCHPCCRAEPDALIG